MSDQPETTEKTEEPIPVEPDPELTESATHPETIDATAEEIPEPLGTDLIPRDNDGDVYRVMSLEDERQIMSELQGRALDTMLYSFEQGGSLLTGFSWAGIRESVRTLNARGLTRIRMAKDPEPKWTATTNPDGGDAIMVVVYAEDDMHGGGNYGVGVQPLQMKLRNGNTKPDPFAPHKALSKAQRNAMEPLCPAEALEAIKMQYLGSGRVKRIPSVVDAAQDRPELPAPLTDERAKAQVETARGIFSEIREINPVALVPGAFNRLLMQTQHDHARLDDTIAHLEAMRDGERELLTLRERLTKLAPKKELEKLMARVDRKRSQEEKKTELLDAIGHLEGGS